MRISDWSSDVCSSDLSFAVVGEELLQKRAKKLAAGTATRERRLFEKDLEPYVGGRPVAEVTAPELLAALRRIEARGAVETAHRARPLAAQEFRYAIATGRAERNDRKIVGSVKRVSVRVELGVRRNIKRQKQTT